MALLKLQQWLEVALFVTLVSAYVDIDADTAKNKSISETTPWSFSLFNRDLPSGMCAEGTPCVDGSCCDGQTGYCGRDAVHCDPSVCISDCHARADCGSWAVVPDTPCKLNVCCDEYGYCGTTEEFCSTGCQSNCVLNPPSTGSGGDVTKVVIAYVEAWQIITNGDTSSCAQRLLSWIPIDSITHLNVAFGYIQRDSFEIRPIDGTDISIFQAITNLKQQAPGLKIWLSLGGWTYSDNGTDTQPVWGDLTSTTANRAQFIDNLVQFMLTWGFDGVDLDWEYPGASDRGGHDSDTANYVLLMQDLRTRFDLQATANGGWGLSFTAPTSYWYLQWFDVQNMVLYADWINFMTYDLHGQWDSPADTIGSYVYAHTNLTEINEGLQLLWRNDIPSNKVNLGIGFYGRTYTLADPSCTSPGCPFTSGGMPGLCSQTEGYLSYDEIQTIRSRNDYVAIWDKDAGAKYFAFAGDQWVSYDDSDTFAQKVQFANDQGLLGLFIWAIDQDDAQHSALDGLLGGLGKFADHNGVGIGDYTNWTNVASSCSFGDCSDNPVCSDVGFVANGDSISCGNGERRYLCCPQNNSPDPNTCRWDYGNRSPLVGVLCNGQCGTGELLMAQSSWFTYPDSNGNQEDAWCATGVADYCCQVTSTSSSSCTQNEGVCIHINSDTGQPASSDDAAAACPAGKTYLTYSEGSCDYTNGLWNPWCCDEGLDTSSCQWTRARPDEGSNLPFSSQDDCDTASRCTGGQVSIGQDRLGGGSNCAYAPAAGCNGEGGVCVGLPFGYTDRKLCCDPNALSLRTTNLPVNLANIFPELDGTVPPNEPAQWDIKVDPTTNPEGPLGDTNVNDNAFGWYIIAGPPEQVTSMDKRDGSHWTLHGCGLEEHLGRRTVQAVCDEEWEDSNCHEIFLGKVPTTVVLMPEGCGAPGGKYAVAVSMEPSSSLTKRDLHLDDSAVVYDFTFDYNFGPIARRGDPNMLLRIDYSDDPGYWATVVTPPPGPAPKTRDLEAHEAWKRDLDRHVNERREAEIEVERDHDGSWEKYLDHRWRVERRATPDHELHLLHKKWFSATLGEWIEALRHVDIQQDLIRHSVNENFDWVLFDYSKECAVGPYETTAYFIAMANLIISIDTSASLSLIGDFSDLTTFSQSSVLFRNSGSIEAKLQFLANAQLSFNTDPVELFGLQNFGATFSIPGIVTIGPNFRIFGQISGLLTIDGDAQVSIRLANWDYTQQYPNNGGDVQSGLTADSEVHENTAFGQPGNDTAGEPSWLFDVSASGALTMHVTPVAQFGIVFQIQGFDIPDSAIELGLDAFGTILVTAHGNISNQDPATVEACFGANAGYNLYAQISVPTLFGNGYVQNWPISGNTVILLDPNDSVNCLSYTAPEF
ncbi:family 18 glycosyl hydrolase [Hypoxylon crocopeplum]|nr:family 18 glycosyl hydrolase [Hypoxylon crocopeplum]